MTCNSIVVIVGIFIFLIWTPQSTHTSNRSISDAHNPMMTSRAFDRAAFSRGMSMTSFPWSTVSTYQCQILENTVKMYAGTSYGPQYLAQGLHVHRTYYGGISPVFIPRNHPPRPTPPPQLRAQKKQQPSQSKETRARLMTREGRMLPKSGAGRRASPLRLSDNSSLSYRRVATGGSVMQHHID